MALTCRPSLIGGSVCFRQVVAVWNAAPQIERQRKLESSSLTGFAFRRCVHSGLDDQPAKAIPGRCCVSAPDRDEGLEQAALNFDGVPEPLSLTNPGGNDWRLLVSLTRISRLRNELDGIADQVLQNGRLINWGSAQAVATPSNGISKGKTTRTG